MSLNKKIGLIFGITGQDGSYLAELLLEKGYEVHGVIRRSSSFNTGRIDHIFNRINLHYGDVTDSLSIDNIINKIKPDEIYNLAAQSITKDSLCPMLTSKGLVLKTLEELWNSNVSRNKEILIEKINGVDVEILEMGDNTLTKAMGYWNGMGSFFRIKQISRHKYQGQICEMKQKFGSINVTPNHSILDTSQKVRMPIENPWLLNVRKLNYKPKHFLKTLNLKLNGVYLKDDKYFWLDENGIKGKIKRNLNEDELSNFCEFIGAFVTEGHTTYNKANKSYFVGISQQDKKWLEKLEYNLKKFYDGNYCYIKHKKNGYEDVWELQIKSRALYNLMRNLCGEKSQTKKLPEFFTKLETKNLQIIFDKMIEGDGCYEYRKYQKDSYRYTTSSYKLACQFSLLNTMLNYDYTVNEEDGGYYHFRECSYYSYNQASDSKKIKMVDYDDYVYDISVDEVENFTTGVGNIVVHNSHVQVSFELPNYTTQVDGLGTLNVIETARKHVPNARIYQASTSELFGGMEYNRPITGYTEVSPMHPRSPYSVAKLYGFWICKNYRESYNQFISNGILFNHSSERRGGNFVEKKIVDALVRIVSEIKLNNISTEILTLGNLYSKRDIGYAKEYVEGMWLMLQQDKPDDYVLATNETYTIKDMVNYSLDYLNIEYYWKGEGLEEKCYQLNSDIVLVSIDEKYFRPAEVDFLLGDATKAKNILGWEAKTKLPDLLKIMIDDVLNK